jgi:histidinol-phosphate/aromatic aminotransferase/cobyric acid decarboxylase-like protein
LVSCPNCGTEVAAAIKCWIVAPTKHKTIGDIPEFRVGIFMCPKCKSKFSSKVDAAANPEITNLKALAAKTLEIHEGLTQTLRNLREKIKILETERGSLLVELDNLKKVTQSRANFLAIEVNRLREELKSLRELFGASKKAD